MQETEKSTLTLYKPTFKIFSACSSIFAWDRLSLSVSSPGSDAMLVVKILALLSKKCNQNSLNNNMQLVNN